MGWWDSVFGGSSQSDPLANLDPKVREFLERESPVKYTTKAEQEQQTQRSQPQQQQQPVQPAPPQPTSTTTTPTTQDAQDPNKPVVPRESLFQDGRYAHLWKTYKSRAAVEAETKTDHEKLMDVLEGFKSRKQAIGRAALENCADEQLDWNNCMKGGSWKARMTMCREEVQKFERCYNMQSRLLKALGYLSAYDRPPEVEEDIQMRADELYHRMLDQEAAIEKAKEEGRPAPAFAPISFESQGVVSPASAAVATAPAAAAAAAPAAAAPAAAASPAATATATIPVPEPPQHVLDDWKKKLDKLPEAERAAEEAALRAEHRAQAESAARIHQLWQEQAKEREARRAEGKATIGDKIKGFWGTG